ncbi:hypothetical protein F5B18DRAFT_658069 [Nemania serpens]|nr:hypothetical protein F5B18DRAFT_658069 [Nemania serpens]
MGTVDFSTDVEEHANTILQVCSYHRRDFDLVVVRSRPHEMQLVQASLQSAFKTLPTASLGILGRLPVELIFLTLYELDIRSFFCFRQVNRQARIISTSLWEYNLVSKHGLEGLRGLLRAELAPYFTISDLYRPLITDKCSTCGAFGGHLFLLTAERCCFDCLLTSARYRVIAPSTLADIASMSPSRLGRLSGQWLRTVPGIYNMMRTPARRPKHLLLEDKATQALLSNRVIGEDKVIILGRRREPKTQRFMAATAYPYYSLEDAKLEPGISCKGCQIRHQRFNDCFISRDRVFSTRGFLSHFSLCVEAQHHWAASERGTRPVDEPQITRSCGYFNKLGDDGLPA